MICRRRTVYGTQCRDRRFSADGIWDKILAALLAPRLAAAAAAVETGSTGHGSGSAAAEAVAELLAPDIGGWVELPAFAQVTGHLSPFSGCITSRTGPLPKCRLHPWRDIADP